MTDHISTVPVPPVAQRGADADRLAIRDLTAALGPDTLDAEVATTRERLSWLEAKSAVEKEEAKQLRQALEQREAELRGHQVVLTRDLDAELKKIRKALPGFEQFAGRIDEAVARYNEATRGLGYVRSITDEAVLRHPIAKLMPWLALFAAPESRDR